MADHSRLHKKSKRFGQNHNDLKDQYLIKIEDLVPSRWVDGEHLKTYQLNLNYKHFFVYAINIKKPFVFLNSNSKRFQCSNLLCEC